MAQPARLDELRIDRSPGQARKRRPAWLIVLLIVLVAVGAGAWWLATRTSATAVRVVAVRESTGAPQPGAVLNASGYVTARRRATVSSKVTGKVTQVLVEEGMAVRKGQVLARLDESGVRAYLNLAEAQLSAAERAVTETEVRLREARQNLERTRQLAAQGISGQANLDTAQAEVDTQQARLAASLQQVDVARRQVEVRRTELADTVIRAPFDGIAISKDAQPGEMVSPISAGGGFTRTGICTIVDMSSLEIEVDVGESYINRVRPGQRVTATLDAYPDWQIPGHVITTIPAADRQRATVLVRIAFEQLDPRVLPDMGVKVAFLEDAPQLPISRARLVVPRAAVRKDAGVDIVYVLRGDSVERRAIRLGGTQGDQIEVASGLTVGEQVVVNAPPTLKHGDRVTVR